MHCFRAVYCLWVHSKGDPKRSRKFNIISEWHKRRRNHPPTFEQAAQVELEKRPFSVLCHLSTFISPAKFVFKGYGRNHHRRGQMIRKNVCVKLRSKIRQYLLREKNNEKNMGRNPLFSLHLEKPKALNAPDNLI